MRHVLHILIPPATAPDYDFVTKPFAHAGEKSQVESITVAECNAAEVLQKIFSSESVSVWLELEG